MLDEKKEGIFFSDAHLSRTSVDHRTPNDLKGHEMKRTHSISRLALLLGFCLPGAIVVGQWSASAVWDGTGVPCHDYVWTAQESLELVPPTSQDCSVYTVCPTAIECQPNRNFGWEKMIEKPIAEAQTFTTRCRKKVSGTYNHATNRCENGRWLSGIDGDSSQTRGVSVTKICTAANCPPETPHNNEP